MILFVQARKIGTTTAMMISVKKEWFFQVLSKDSAQWKNSFYFQAIEILVPNLQTDQVFVLLIYSVDTSQAPWQFILSGCFFKEG